MPLEHITKVKLPKLSLKKVDGDIKAIVLATAATVLAVTLFNQSASWKHTIRKLNVYFVQDIAITFLAGGG